MSPEEFLKEFGHLAETEGGPDKVRSLLLQLAISGRLTGGTSPTAGEQPNLGEFPYPLPRGWRWVSTAEAGEVQLGRQRSPKNHRGPHMVPYLRVANVHEDEIRVDDLLEMNFTPVEQETFRLQPGDLLLNEGQSYELVGRPALYRGEVPGACFQNTLLRFRANADVLPEYALVVFRCYLRNGRFRRHAQQTTNIAHLSAGRLKTIEFPLPPLPEQKRIVEKVDQLMALCDELEAKQKEKRAKAVSFNQAALNAVVHAPDKSKLKSSWSRVQDHFEVLYELPENVKELRQTILQLAVMGKLVRQDRKDEPFALPGWPRSPSTPTNLPASWALPTLGELGEFMGGGTPSKGNADYWSGDIPWVSPKDMKVLWLSDSQDHVADSAVEETAIKLIPRGSVLCVVRGMILAHSFPVAVNEVPVTINQDMKALVPVVPEIAPYLLLALRGLRDTVLGKVERSSHGTCRLASDDLAGLRVPLPPLGEQSRIVTKVDQLMSICDDLEGRLAQHREQGQRLMQAVVEGLVA